MAKNYVSGVPLVAISAAGLLQTYTAINPLGLTNALFLLLFVNTSDAPIVISLDGVSDYDVVFPGSRLPIPSQTNSQPNAQYALWSRGDVFYARYDIDAPSEGNIAVGGYYVPN